MPHSNPGLWLPEEHAKNLAKLAELEQTQANYQQLIQLRNTAITNYLSTHFPQEQQVELAELIALRPTQRNSDQLTEQFRAVWAKLRTKYGPHWAEPTRQLLLEYALLNAYESRLAQTQSRLEVIHYDQQFLQMRLNKYQAQIEQSPK